MLRAFSPDQSGHAARQHPQRFRIIHTGPGANCRQRQILLKHILIHQCQRFITTALNCGIMQLAGGELIKITIHLAHENTQYFIVPVADLRPCMEELKTPCFFRGFLGIVDETIVDGVQKRFNGIPRESQRHFTHSGQSPVRVCSQVVGRSAVIHRVAGHA